MKTHRRWRVLTVAVCAVLALAAQAVAAQSNRAPAQIIVYETPT